MRDLLKGEDGELIDSLLIELQNKLSCLGVREGDMLYVASDVSVMLSRLAKEGLLSDRMMREEFFHRLVTCFQNVVGKSGTLLFPVFSWRFCRGEEFHIKTTLGEVGAWNNWILQNRGDFVRTQHPIYSFMVWGKEAANLARMANIDAWGEDSPFAYLHREKGKMLLFNVSLQRAFTFMHYVENCLKVPYRYNKEFRGTYIDAEGKASTRAYRMYVRDMSIQSQEYVPDSFLEEPGAMWNVEWNGLSLKLIDLKHAYIVFQDDLLNHGGEHCYIFKNYAIDWSKGATHADDIGN